MELLTEISRYYTLLSEAKAAYSAAGPAYSNCYSTADAIERYISQRRLYAAAQPGGGPVEAKTGKSRRQSPESGSDPEKGQA